MEIEKRYRTYGIALGIDLGIESGIGLFDITLWGGTELWPELLELLMKNFLVIWFYNIQNDVTKINTELINEFLVEIYFRNYTDLWENFVNFK